MSQTDEFRVTQRKKSGGELILLISDSVLLLDSARVALHDSWFETIQLALLKPFTI